MPYEDRTFRWIDDVGRAVQSGIRPTIELPAPADYVSLMENCWHTNPDVRPMFREVAERLNEMMRSDSIPASRRSSEIEADTAV